MKHRYKIFIFTGFFFLLIIYFSPVLFGKSFFWEDFLYQNYPYRFFAAVSLRHRVFPFWNPYIFGGIPFFADVQSAVLYPFNLILTFFVHNNILSYKVVEFQDIFHLFLAGIFMYMLLRYLKVSRISASISGFAYMLNGRFVVNLMHINTINTIIWLPLMVYLLMRAIEERKIKYAIYGGITLGIATLAGYPQAIVMIIIATLIYFIITLFYVNKKSKWRDILLNLKIYLILLFIGIGISAIQYVPTYKLFKLSPRSKYTYEEIVEGSFPPSHFITFLMPKIFGSPESGNGRFYYGRSFQNYKREATCYYWELSIYIGIITLILAVIGTIYMKTRLKIFILTVILFGLSFALGKYFIIHWIFYKFVPFFNNIRTPAKFLHLYIFGMIIASGFGMDAILQKKEGLKKHYRIFLWLILFIPVIYIIFYFGFYQFISEKFFKINAIKQFIKFSVLWFLSLSTIFLFLRNKINKKIFISASALILAFDLFIFGFRFNNKGINPYIFYFLKKIEDPSDKAIDVIKNEQNEFIRVSGRDYYIKGFTESRMLPRNMGMIQHIFTIDGYNPLQTMRFSTLFRYLRDYERMDIFYNLLGVKYYPEANPQYHRTFSIKQNSAYLPRAFLVKKYRVIKDINYILWLIKNGNIDFHKEVLLEKAPTFKISGIDSFSYVEMLDYSLNRIDIQTHTNTPSILVLDEVYYPLWKAYIDGKKAEIIPADYVLRAVAIPSGNHLVAFKYSKKMLFKGILLMIIVEFIAFLIYLNVKKSREA